MTVAHIFLHEENRPPSWLTAEEHQQRPDDGILVISLLEHPILKRRGIDLHTLWRIAQDPRGWFSLCIPKGCQDVDESKPTFHEGVMSCHMQIRVDYTRVAGKTLCFRVLPEDLGPSAEIIGPVLGMAASDDLHIKNGSVDRWGLVPGGPQNAEDFSNLGITQNFQFIHVGCPLAEGTSDRSLRRPTKDYPGTQKRAVTLIDLENVLLDGKRFYMSINGLAGFVYDGVEPRHILRHQSISYTLPTPRKRHYLWSWIKYGEVLHSTWKPGDPQAATFWAINTSFDATGGRGLGPNFKGYLPDHVLRAKRATSAEREACANAIQGRTVR